MPPSIDSLHIFGYNTVQNYERMEELRGFDDFFFNSGPGEHGERRADQADRGVKKISIFKILKLIDSQNRGGCIMKCSEIMNIIAVIVAPIVAVVVGQWLQDRASNRADKMKVFKTLMTDRNYIWSKESVDALNSIDIIFSDDLPVREQWKRYFERLRTQPCTTADRVRLETEKTKLLEAIANSLGYKDKITWETIQNPYMPQWMTDSIANQQRYMSEQMSLVSMMNQMIKSGNPDISVSSKENSTE